MAYANKPEDYQAKVDRIWKAKTLQPTDHVPYMLNSGTIGYAYAKTPIASVAHDRMKNADAGTRYLEEYFCDGTLLTFNPEPVETYLLMEAPHPTYGYTSDGYAFTHHQGTEETGAMLADEYPIFIEDVEKYMMNVILPRRYPILQKPYPENYEALKKGYASIMEHIEHIQFNKKYAAEKYGVPTLFGTLGVAPMDILMDYFRGFAGIMSDIRRRPEQVLEACEAIERYAERVMYPLVKKGETVTLPLHLPPFLGPKNFEKFYWPSFKQSIDFIIKKGGHADIALEGDWTPYMDWLFEFPRGRVSCIVDQGDIIAFKKKYGDHVSLAGGLSLEMLKSGTPEQCADEAKRIIDECGPGGGFMLSTDKQIMFASDLNHDNMKAVEKVVLSYR